MLNMTSFEVLNKQPKLTVGYSVFTQLVVEVENFNFLFSNTDENVRLSALLWESRVNIPFFVFSYCNYMM